MENAFHYRLPLDLTKDQIEEIIMKTKEQKQLKGRTQIR
jgi:hypothetical protein